MSGWKIRRFWTRAEVVSATGGFVVQLDGKPVRTPAKAPLIAPTLAMGAAVAAEWAAQGQDIDPSTMPVTRAVNAAIDKVIPQFGEVAQLVAAYGETDLLCYRSQGPQALVNRQADAWDPVLDWAAGEFGARLHATTGIVFCAQSPESVARLRDLVAHLDAFRLTALSDLVGISGSLVLGLAVLRGHLAADTAWALSRIDEDWQAEQWGADDEAEIAAAKKRSEFGNAARFLALCDDRGDA